MEIPMIIWVAVVIILFFLMFVLFFAMGNCCYCFPQPKKEQIVISENLEEVVVGSNEVKEGEENSKMKNSERMDYSNVRSIKVKTNAKKRDHLANKSAVYRNDLMYRSMLTAASQIKRPVIYKDTRRIVGGRQTQRKNYSSGYDKEYGRSISYIGDYYYAPSMMMEQAKQTYELANNFDTEENDNGNYELEDGSAGDYEQENISHDDRGYDE